MDWISFAAGVAVVLALQFSVCGLLLLVLPPPLDDKE